MQDSDTQHLKKYKERIDKTIVGIRQKEINQVIFILNTLIISLPKFNFALDTLRRKREIGERDQRQNQAVGRHDWRGD